VSQPATARDRTAEQIRRIRRSRIRRERLASVSLGIALPVAAFFLELGLDKNVASYPLHRWREALDHAHSAGRLGTVKVAFDPRSTR